MRDVSRDRPPSNGRFNSVFDLLDKVELWSRGVNSGVAAHRLEHRGQALGGLDSTQEPPRTAPAPSVF